MAVIKPKQYRDPILSVSGDPIGFYEREFYPFSNFSSFQVKWQGRLWPTSEHAYQAAKFFETDKELVQKIFEAKSAHVAAEIGRDYREKQQPDWDEVKIGIMEDICKHKLIQHPYVKRKLLQTGDALLAEDSPKDSFWGWGPNHKGRNELGKVWMRLRASI